MAAKLDVRWCPIQNRFITWSYDNICLYETRYIQDTAQYAIKISNKYAADVIGSINIQTYLKCLDIYPKSDRDLFLAMGFSNGNIKLSTFSQLEWEPKSSSVKELVPKYTRQCNSVVFNPVESNLLASGLEKYKPDNCVAIWDINQLSSSNNVSSFQSFQATPAVELPKPLWEFGMSEHCQNIVWFHNNSKILAAGMNMKHIKLIDIRDFYQSVLSNNYHVIALSVSCSTLGMWSSERTGIWMNSESEEAAEFSLPFNDLYERRSSSTCIDIVGGKILINSPRMVNSTLTKAAFGVCTNPKDDKYLASYFENQIFIWDTRHIEKPIQILTQHRQIVKIGWCPTKSCLLTCLQKDSNVLSLFDIEHPIVETEEVEPTVLERIVNPNSPCVLTSFCWHPSDENRIISVGPSEKSVIIDYQIFDRIIIGWTPTFDVVWSSGKKVLKTVNISAVPEIQDISLKMIDRAKKGYGLTNELYKNASVVKSDEILSNVWNWLHLSMKLVEDNKLTSTSGSVYKHPGVLYVLNIDPDKNPSETVTVSWAELGHPNCGGSTKYYKHEDRNNALLLCSWPTDRDPVLLNNFVNSLERAGAYTRAAALAVFNLKVQLAIDILSRAPSQYGSSLNIVAMALSGFSDDPNSVWKKFCSSSINTLTDPYLKAMFGFLTADGNYESLLNESNITVDDRVALACIFLPDTKLMEYMRKLSFELCDQGNLDGLLLTGNSVQGLKLLGKYQDVTGDIQSATLIAVRAFSNEINSTVVQNWILNYHSLLNMWKLWFERADFDVMMARYKREKPLQQIYVSCAYCGKNISAHMRSLKTQQYSRINMAGSSNKLTACPHCRKPLPRCTVCLMNMGGSVDDDDSDKLTGFDSCFTWCQHCRHGGHSKHMLQWFEEHLECPQVGCTCRCNSLDHMSLRY